MATQNNNVILLEKDASSPLRGAQRTVDAADDIVLAPATVSIQPTGNVAINSVSGTLSMGNSASTQAINIGTAGARIITIGQGVGTGPTIVLDGVTNATQIESNGVLAIGSNYTAAESIFIGSATNGVFPYARTILIGNTSSSSGVTLYAGSMSQVSLVGPISITSATNATVISSTSGAISIDGTTTGTIGIGTQGGTGAINIGTAATNRTITLGNVTNTSAFTINAGSGGISLWTNATAGTINVGTDNGTGTISIGTGTGARAINIGTGAANGTISIGTSASAGRQVVIGNTTGTSNTVINGGSNGIIIGGSTATSFTTPVVVGDSTGAQTLRFGVGAGAKTVTVGSTNTTSSTAIQTGTGAMTFTAGGIYDVNAAGAVTIDSSGGTIGIGTDNVNQDINFGTAGTRFINLGSTLSTRSVNLRVGSRGALIDIGATYGMRGFSYSCVNRTASTISDGFLVALQISPAADNQAAQVVLANASGVATARIPLGAAMNQGGAAFSAGSNGNVQYMGMFPVKFAVAPAGGADIGKPVYLSETDGQATLTAPSTSGSTIYLIGYLARGVADAAGLWYVMWRPQFIADIP